MPVMKKVAEVEIAYHGCIPKCRIVDRGALGRSDHRTDLSVRIGRKSLRDLGPNTIATSCGAPERINEDFAATVEHRIWRWGFPCREDEVNDRFQCLIHVCLLFNSISSIGTLSGMKILLELQQITRSAREGKTARRRIGDPGVAKDHTDVL